MASGTERSRRSRAHKRGDHTLCLQASCELAGLIVDATPLATPLTRGQHLMAAMDEGRDLAPAHRVLLEEACRIADRLDRLDDQLEHKKNWLDFLGEDGESEVTVIVDKVLAESRQQAAVLKQIVSELRMAGAAAARSPAPQAGLVGVSAVGDISARIAARRRASLG